MMPTYRPEPHASARKPSATHRKVTESYLQIAADRRSRDQPIIRPRLGPLFVSTMYDVAANEADVVGVSARLPVSPHRASGQTRGNGCQQITHRCTRRRPSSQPPHRAATSKNVTAMGIDRVIISGTSDPVRPRNGVSAPPGPPALGLRGGPGARAARQ